MITLDPKVTAALEASHKKLEAAGEIWQRARLDEIGGRFRARFGFPIVERTYNAAHQEYLSKRLILEIYDAMQRAIETGTAYETRLDPPPGDARVAHPARTPERAGAAAPIAPGPTA